MPRFAPLAAVLRAAAPLALFLGLLLARSATADSSLTREVTRSFKVRGEVHLRNIAGAVTVSRAAGGAGAGDATTVRAIVHAAGVTAAEAQALLDALDLRFDETATGLAIEAGYPLDKHRVYRYPDLGRGGNSTTNSTYDGKRITVTTREDDEAVTLWVDVELQLGPGVGVRIKELAGETHVSGAEGPVAVENGWGDITVADVRGEVKLDTGSGDVEVRRQHGPVSIDTGSGDVLVEEVSGAVDADTGSGDVQVTRAAGKVRVDTGSGDVELSGVAGPIDIDTGSGDARIADATGSQVMVDTGAGSIMVESPALFRDPGAATARFETGAGDVILLVDDQVSMLLDFSSGSGRVRSPRALAGRIERIGPRGERRYRVGGESSRVTVDTGAGDVILRLARE